MAAHRPIFEYKRERIRRLCSGLLFGLSLSCVAGDVVAQSATAEPVPGNGRVAGAQDTPWAATADGVGASAHEPGDAPAPVLSATAGGTLTAVASPAGDEVTAATAMGGVAGGGGGPEGMPPGQVDQSQLSVNTCMAFFSQTDLAQSFVTSARTLAGARIDLDPDTGGADVRISLYDALPNAGGALVASGVAFDVPDGGSAVVSFGDVPVNPGDQYFLVFTALSGNPCIAGSTFNPYPDGQVYANDGFGPFPEFDYAFETYGDPAPMCGPMDQSQTRVNTCMAFFGQSDLAQSFRTTATALCGARVDLASNGGADVTIDLWDGLPGAGGVMLASGTDFNVPSAGTARVDFGGPVPVTPGDEYFLVFSAPPDAVACLAGDTEDPYLGGHVYANAGFGAFPDFDYAFETYGPQLAPCGPPDQTQMSVNTCMATFGQIDLAQSFVADATSLCGASVELSANVGEGAEDVAIELWDRLPNDGGRMLASGVDYGVPIGGTAMVDFGADVAVTPGVQYYLVFKGLSGQGCFAGDTEDPYVGGMVHANNGFNPFPEYDYAFRTYGSGRAACGPPDQSQLSESTCMAFFSQTDLAQSFTAGTTALCGARVDLRTDTGNDVNVTIGLWDALPDEGGTLLAGATDFGVADGGAAIVDFGEAVPVTPGVRYFLVFTATNGNACIAGNTLNPIPGGHVYANSGYGVFPNYDYTFETYGIACESDCGGTPDGFVNVVDLLAMLGAWGSPGACDLDGSGVNDVTDLLMLLGAWGPCIE